jgi:hypothetical protein
MPPSNLGMIPCSIRLRLFRRLYSNYNVVRVVCIFWDSGRPEIGFTFEYFKKSVTQVRARHNLISYLDSFYSC